jgi:hypothetical protein
MLEQGLGEREVWWKWRREGERRRDGDGRKNGGLAG